ncbi:MAG: hypothetical protein AAGG38_04230 [Planctomycetota bacterium]
MSFLDLDAEQIAALVGTRHGETGVEFPEAGLQPYHDWLIRTLHRLAERSLGALRVERSDTAESAVWVAAGRASLAGEAVVVEARDLDLAAFNNSTAYVWLEAGEGSGEVEAGASEAGWPGGAHLKLAEVVLASGRVESVVDRRLETVFRG